MSCLVKDCDNEVFRRGYCRKHYMRVLKYGSPTKTSKGEDDELKTYSKCVVEGCESKTRSKHSPYCEKHYYRLRRTNAVESELDKKSTGYCLHCGKKLTGKDKLCCSQRCDARYRRGLPLKATCKHCKAEFVPVNGKDYCSKKCRAQEERNRAIDKYATSPIRKFMLRLAGLTRKQLKQKLGGVKFTNKEIFERDKWICGVCGKPVDQTLKFPHPYSKSLDHIVSLRNGGLHDPSNVQLAHLHCNWSKNSRERAKTTTSVRLGY